KASAAGLDQEQPMADYFGPKLTEAVQAGRVPMSEIDDHARRVLYAEFLSGIVDDPPQKSVVDVEKGLETAQHVEEESIVLLKNAQSVLPIDPSKVHSIAIIGGHADVGMISGGGSAQVDPPGGNAIMPPEKSATHWQDHIWFPTSPLKALRAKLPNAKIDFNSGTDVSSAANLAKNSDLAIVFAYQWISEGMDLPSLSLPDNQDALIEQVAAANPHTIVVLETGTAVTMPWLDKVQGVVEAWYAGSDGAHAVANVLFRDVNPTAKLPMTFPRSVADLPHPHLVTPPPGSTGKAAVQKTGDAKPTFSVHYDEGVKVGYKWYDAEHKAVLFPFGYGLSYTNYAYSNFKVEPGKEVRVTFTVANTGSRAGAEIAEVYAALQASTGEPTKRLVGWSKVELHAGEIKDVTVEVEPKYLSIFNVEKDSW